MNHELSLIFCTTISCIIPTANYYYDAAKRKDFPPEAVQIGRGRPARDPFVDIRKYTESRLGGWMMAERIQTVSWLDAAADGN